MCVHYVHVCGQLESAFLPCNDLLDLSVDGLSWKSYC